MKKSHVRSPLAAVLLATVCGACDGLAVSLDVGVDADVQADAGRTDMRADPPDAADDAGIDEGLLDQAVPDMDPPDVGSPPDLGPPIGEVVISRWQADSNFVDDEIYAQAVFSPALLELNLQNPLGYLFSFNLSTVGIAVGAFEVADVGEFTQLAPDLGIEGLSDFDFLDAGNAVLIGDDLVLNAHDETIESDAAWLYESLVDDGVYFAERYAEAPLDLYIAGGADVPEMTLPGAVSMPEPLVITSHNIGEIMPLRYGVPLTLSWAPSADPDDTVLVVAETEFDGVALHLDDALGQIDLGDALARLDLSKSAVDAISIIRRRVSQVATEAGTIQVSTHARQVLLPEPVGPATVTPRVVDRGAVVALKVAWWDGVLAENTTVDLGPGIIVLTQEIDQSGHILRLQVAVADDAILGSRPVSIQADGVVRVALIDTLFVADELPMAGECYDAEEEPALQPGTYRGSLAGLTDSAYDVEDCLQRPHEGADQAMPIELRAGEILIARVIDSTSLYGLYLIDDCDDFSPVDYCYTRSSAFETTRLVYQAFEDESHLLVIDERRQGNAMVQDRTPSGYILDVQILPAEPLIIDPQVVGAGSIPVFDVHATAGAFDETTQVTFDGVVIDEIDIVDPQLLQFSAPVPDELLSRWIPIEVSLAGGDMALLDEGALLVAYREPANDCAGAQDDPPLRPGTYNSLTLLVDQTIDTPPQCGQADGYDGVFRIELGASETVRFWVYANDFDPVIYLLEDCAPTAVQCVDNTSYAGVEYLEFVGGPEPATLYLVIDGFDAAESGSFELDMEIVQ
ncbi:MAG: hypothetical protein ACI9U2_003879 [Bradymonadia bacterium]|jgi:hypothetical protein